MNRKLPVDTVKLYGKKISREYLSNHPAFEFKGSNGIMTEFWVTCPFTGYRKTLKHHGSTGSCTLEIALPRLVYPNNATLLTLAEAKAAIEILSEHTGLNLLDFQICRLDVTNDIGFKPKSLKTVRPQLQAPSHYQKKRIDYENNGFNFGFATKPRAKNKRSEKYLQVYGKDEKTRIESRIFSAPAIKRTLGVTSNLKLRDILTDAFINRANEYYTGLVEQVTKKNPKHKLVKHFKKVALAEVLEPVLY